MWKAIEHDIATLDLAPNAAVMAKPSGVDFLVQPHQAREVSGTTSKGAPRYTTKHWIDVTNTGDRDADAVTFEAITGAGQLMVLGGPKSPTIIHKGQCHQLSVMYAASGSDGAVLRIRWSEDGTAKERDFHVG